MWSDVDSRVQGVYTKTTKKLSGSDLRWEDVNDYILGVIAFIVAGIQIPELMDMCLNSLSSHCFFQKSLHSLALNCCTVDP